MAESIDESFILHPSTIGFIVLGNVDERNTGAMPAGAGFVIGNLTSAIYIGLTLLRTYLRTRGPAPKVSTVTM